MSKFVWPDKVIHDHDGKIYTKGGVFLFEVMIPDGNVIANRINALLYNEASAIKPQVEALQSDNVRLEARVKELEGRDSPNLKDLCDLIAKAADFHKKSRCGKYCPLFVDEGRIWGCLTNRLSEAIISGDATKSTELYWQVKDRFDKASEVPHGR